MNSHVSKRACSSKSADKTQATCFGCSRAFYLHCFNATINKVNQKSFFTTDSPVQFVCNACQDEIKARSNDAQLSDQLKQITELIKSNNSHHIHKLDAIADKLSLVESPHVTKSNNPDAPSDVVVESNSNNSDLDVIGKIDALIDVKFSQLYENIPSRRQLDEILMKLTTMEVPSEPCRYTNVLDWSISSPSPRLKVPNTSDDLFSLLHSFESNTWSSFDSIISLLKKNSATLDNIAASAVHPHSTCKSPLVETIQRDERLDSIHNNVCDLVNDLTILKDDFQKLLLLNRDFTNNYDDPSSPSMTESELDVLRDRFKAILSTPTNHSPSSSDIDHSPLPLVAPVSLQRMSEHDNNCIESATLPIPNDDDHVVTNVHLLGESVQSHQLGIAFHVSPFDVRVTPDNIMSYISANAQIDSKRIKIHRLTKRGQDVSALRHVNFKIETDDATSKIISRSSFWPSHISIKPWTSKNVHADAREHFLAN